MRSLLLAAACAALVACASSPATDAPSAGDLKLLEPQIGFVQLVGPADQQYPAGDIEVKFGLRILNRSAETLTLRRVRLEPVSMGGPYAVRRSTYHFNTALSPEKTTDVTFWAKAVAEGDAYATDARAPVGVRGYAYFEGPSGSFRVVFAGSFSQGGGPTASQ